MPQPYSRFSDSKDYNALTAKKLVAPNGPLTRWRRDHPNGDPVDWQEIPSDHAVLLRFRGGPFLVNQFEAPNAFELGRVYRGQLDGFTGIVYRTGMHFGMNQPEYETFMVFSIDTPRSVPRTEIRPAVFSDRFTTGFHGTKTGSAEFDKHFHVQTEDEGFARALVSPSAMAFFMNDDLAQTLSVIFEGSTLSTWNHLDVTKPSNDQYIRDYMSLLVDYLIRLLKSTPVELWRG